jgi:hypothetical protein
LVTGEARSPEVILRQRVEMTDGTLEGAAQPYHAAEGLPLAEAKRCLARYKQSADAMAYEALRSIVAELRAVGMRRTRAASSSPPAAAGHHSR